MPMLEAALVGANQSSLEQRGDEVDARHDFVSRVGAATDNSGLMLIASRRQSRITAPSVGMNDSPKLHGALDEGKQAVCRDIPDMLKADAAEPRPFFPAAMAMMALRSVSRPRVPASGPPT
jgi:hypothetical protein